MNKKILLHCHIFKNAGTTIDWALECSFSDRFLDHRDDLDMRRSGLNYLDNFLYEHPEIIALSSHHMPFFPEHGKSYYWLVLLREPLRRARSVYDFEVKQEPSVSLGSRMAKEMNFSEYIVWRMRDDVPAVIKNYHVRYLSGITNPAKSINEGLFDKAFQRLGFDNVIFGVVEKFDESMVVFEEYLKRDFPEIDLSYVRQNASANREEMPLAFLDKLTDEARGLLIDNNQWDMKLYDIVSSKHEKTFNKIPGFFDKLENFKARCRALAVEHDIRN